MAKRKTSIPVQSTRLAHQPARAAAVRPRRDQYSYCSLRPTARRVLAPDVGPERARLIMVSDQKWVNGTVLHYYFFDKPTDGETVYFSDGTSEWRSWTTTEAERKVVRSAFDVWKSIGIGLEFKEVNARDEAEIRIGFQRGDGAWSAVGREILEIGHDQRTMNFGWDLTSHPSEIDTAVHEIGHTLGFPHEHQNPNAGIVWNEEAVYAALAEAPNNWDRQKTYYNIIRKIDPDTVQGSNWDPNSIMHYPFRAGLIRTPDQYRNGLQPAGGLSERDKTWVKTFYPSLTEADYAELKLLQSVPLNIAAGQQTNFTIRPKTTRYYEFRTFGNSDTIIVLFEDDNGELRYRTADDDSGEDYNAYLRIKLIKGRRYVLRVRLYYAERSGETAVMMW